MGMDVYALPLYEESQERQRLRERFHAWVARRDAARAQGDKRAEKAAQRKVDRYDDRMNSGRLGYFRVSYNPLSLSCWLEYNVEKGAKGDWGLAIFFDAIKGKADPVVDEEGFRQRLLATARRWYAKALKLKDKESIIRHPNYGDDGCSPGQGGMTTHRLSPNTTNWYIAWLKELVDFAEVVAEGKYKVEVSA